MNFQAVKSFKTTKKAPFFTHITTPWSQESNLIFSSDDCNNIRLHTNNGVILLTNYMIKPQNNTVTALTYNVKHNVAVVGYSNGELIFFKQSGKDNNSKTYKPHNSIINYLETSVDQNRILTCSNDKIIKIYELKRSKGFVKPIFSISVSSHTGFVLKASLSDNLFSVYSIDSRIFRITDLKNKLDTCIYEANNFKGPFQSFHEMRDGLVLLQYESRNFEILDSRLNQIIKSFSLDLPSILKTEYAIESNKLFAISRKEKGKQFIMVIDLTSGDKQEFTMNFEVTDILCDRKGERFLVAGEGDIVLYTDQMAFKPDGNNKTKPRINLGLYNNISSIVPIKGSVEKLNSQIIDKTQEKPIESNPAINSQVYALLVAKLGRYAASIQTITNSLKLLDEKLEKNELTVSNLNKDIELVIDSREAHKQQRIISQHDNDTRRNIEQLFHTQDSSNLRLIEDTKSKEIKTFYEPQIKIEYQPFLTLREQMQADLDLLRNFVADKDVVSEKMIESNFSFMKNESYNVFDNVIGHKFKEDTGNFPNISQNLQTVNNPSLNLTVKSNGLTQQLATDKFNYTLSNIS